MSEYVKVVFYPTTKPAPVQSYILFNSLAAAIEFVNVLKKSKDDYSWIIGNFADVEVSHD